MPQYGLVTNGGNKKRRDSKKKDLSEYHLCIKEQSSQSDDDVETESLFSLKDDYHPNKTSESSDCLFKPHASVFSDENKTNSLIFTQQDSVDVGLDSETQTSSIGNEIYNKTRLREAKDCIVDVKREIVGKQVFSSPKHLASAEKEVIEEKDKKKVELVKRRSKRLIKTSQGHKDEFSVPITNNLSDNSRKDIVSSTKLKDDFNERVKKMLTSLSLTTTTSKKNNFKDTERVEQVEGRTKEKVIGSVSEAPVNEQGYKGRRRPSTSSSVDSKGKLDSSDTPPIRVDQFNKICPSPFANAPGFRRSQSIQYRPQKLTGDSDPKISKSSSFDTAKLSMTSSSVVGREKWIQFEEESQDQSLANVMKDWVAFGSSEASSNGDVDKEVSLSQQPRLSVGEDEAPTDEEKGLIVDRTTDEGELKKSNVLNKSVDNLLDTVKTTVKLIKGSLTNPEKCEDPLIESSHDRSSSLISDDEIISLEFDTDEEKLRDTPIKQFPDVSLFQVSVIGTDRDNLKLVLNKDENESSNTDRDNVLDDYPPVITRNSWKFWYRYPDKKKKVGSRKWIPVIVYIDNDFLKINTLNGHTPEIKKEVPLHPFYNFTVPIIHKGNKDGKVHSVKLQYVKYKERRRMKAKLSIEHVPVYTPVVKLSCRDIVALREFVIRVEGIIRHISTHRDKGISYEHEEIFIDSEDECSYLISSEGNVLRYNVSVQLRLRCFVSGNPELKLFLNDVNNKEILSRTKEALVRENGKTSTRWINPELYEYHPCVDTNKSLEEGGVVFTPPDGCSFELLRFRLRTRNPLPLVAKTSLEVLRLNSVHIKSEIRVDGDAKNIRHKRNNVIFYIPVPPSWSKLFLKSRLVGRTAKYLSVKTSLKSNEPAKASNTRATFKISAGSASYEPAYGAITWELGTLPIMQDGLAADATHTFECFIELPFPLHIRDDFQPYSYLEFNVKQPMGSKVSVEEILLSDGRVPEKWVCYRSSYMYKLEMRILEDGKEKGRTEDK